MRADRDQQCELDHGDVGRERAQAVARSALSVAANPAGTARTGTVTVAGQTFTVTQLAAACGAFTISPASQSNVAATGRAVGDGDRDDGVRADATSNASWITVTSGASWHG